jgi:hypothetical protein
MPSTDSGNYLTQEEEKEQGYFMPDSKPYGLTYGQWTVKWWNWALSIPKENNPVVDDTGKYANVSQNDPNVFFLAGTFGGATVQRQCTVPDGRAVLFPVINYHVNRIMDPQLITETEMVEEVIKDQDDIINLEATIDGKRIPFYRVRSDPSVFPLTISPDLISTLSPDLIETKKEIPKGKDAMICEAASDGYWIFLKPFAKGEHKIFFAGSCSSGVRNVRAAYNITVA